MELDDVAAMALRVVRAQYRHHAIGLLGQPLHLARSPSSSPRAASHGAEAAAPSRATASRNATSVAKRLRPDSGATVLKTSWVAAGMAVADTLAIRRMM